jgi:ribose transport system ATP-binding protein
VAAAGRRVAPHIYERAATLYVQSSTGDRGDIEGRERAVSVSESGSRLLEVRGLVKDYPGVRALGGVDLTVTSGQVHCLIGQNGAGKSTLIKCVSGLVEPTAGEVRFRGEPLPIGDPNASISRGIATIYQELDLVPHLSVALNVFLGHEHKRGPVLNRASMHRETEALLARPR